MSVRNLKPRTELVKLYPDVESRSLPDAAFEMLLEEIEQGGGTLSKDHSGRRAR